MGPIRSAGRWLWRVLRDPALYIIGFTFYAGMNPWLTLAQLVLCYAGTVLVLAIRESWRTRGAGPAERAQALRDAVLWGSLLFAIGLAWGAACGYILSWMRITGAGVLLHSAGPS